jgi:hypothetical protein
LLDRSEITGVTFPMIHAELFPSPAELPALQQALDAAELTENELILLLAAGPRLAESSEPLNDLHDAVAADSLPGGDEAPPDESPLAGLLATIDKADEFQRRALVIVALRDTWAGEGMELPPPGLNAQK